MNATRLFAVFLAVLVPAFMLLAEPTFQDATATSLPAKDTYGVWIKEQNGSGHICCVVQPSMAYLGYYTGAKSETYPTAVGMSKEGKVTVQFKGRDGEIKIVPVPATVARVHTIAFVDSMVKEAKSLALAPAGTDRVVASVGCGCADPRCSCMDTGNPACTCSPAVRARIPDQCDDCEQPPERQLVAATGMVSRAASGMVELQVKDKTKKVWVNPVYIIAVTGDGTGASAVWTTTVHNGSPGGLKITLKDEAAGQAVLAAMNGE